MKTLIIEDEPLVARELQAKIVAVADDLEVIGVLPSLKTARKWFMANSEPDLLFMDIQLSDGVSFELFDYYELSCPIVFTTAYDEYAIQAFKVNGIDYLLKPVDEKSLKKAIDKCRQFNSRLKAPAHDFREIFSALKAVPEQAVYKEKFIVSVRNQWIPVNTADIACFSKDGIHFLYTKSGERYVVDYATLEEIELLLDPRQFYRANRQYIVHIDAIQSVRLHENQKLTLTLRPPLKMEVDVSREKAPIFKKWFDR